jgi:hypothetical protein
LVKTSLWIIQPWLRSYSCLEHSKKIGTNPDTVRKDQSIYAIAGREISLEVYDSTSIAGQSYDI